MADLAGDALGRALGVHAQQAGSCVGDYRLATLARQLRSSRCFARLGCVSRGHALEWFERVACRAALAVGGAQALGFFAVEGVHARRTVACRLALGLALFEVVDACVRVYFPVVGDSQHVRVLDLLVAGIIHHRAHLGLRCDGFAVQGQHAVEGARADGLLDLLALGRGHAAPGDHLHRLLQVPCASPAVFAQRGLVLLGQQRQHLVLQGLVLDLALGRRGLTTGHTLLQHVKERLGRRLCALRHAGDHVAGRRTEHVVQVFGHRVHQAQCHARLTGVGARRPRTGSSASSPAAGHVLDLVRQGAHVVGVVDDAVRLVDTVTHNLGAACGSFGSQHLTEQGGALVAALGGFGVHGAGHQTPHLLEAGAALHGLLDGVCALAVLAQRRGVLIAPGLPGVVVQGAESSALHVLLALQALFHALGDVQSRERSGVARSLGAPGHTRSALLDELADGRLEQRRTLPHLRSCVALKQERGGLIHGLSTGYGVVALQCVEKPGRFLHAVALEGLELAEHVVGAVGIVLLGPLR